jgi:hypothetical protein
MATGTDSGEFGEMMFGVKPQTPGKFVFPLAQSFIGKFLNGSTVLADHEPMAAFRSIQVTFDKSTTG